MDTATVQQIRAEERERILGTPVAPTGILDRYEVKAYLNEDRPMHFLYCARCHHVMICARYMDGDQTGVTLAELAELAMEHDESHEGPAGVHTTTEGDPRG